MVTKISNSQKIKKLQKERDEMIIKLKSLYVGFHGVRHEDSASEMRYTQIKVTEGYINSLSEEIKGLEKAS